MKKYDVEDMFLRVQYKYLLVVSVRKCLAQWPATTSYESYREAGTIIILREYGLQNNVNIEINIMKLDVAYMYPFTC